MSKCGTYAGYQEHGRRRTPVCDPCRKARNAYMRRYRSRGMAKTYARDQVEAYRRAEIEVRENHRDEFEAAYERIRSEYPSLTREVPA